jgi:LmbE family N-acetylglucosaminyl deacetylase
VRELFFWGSEDSNFRSDISDTFDTKLKALLCHESQVKEMGEEKIKNWLLRQGKEMAEGENFALGEAFHRIEIPK